MGIFMNLSISKSVTKEEWEKVYEETLELIKYLPLAERRSVGIHGVDTGCLVGSEEHEFSFGWCGEDVEEGWAADGDMDTLNTAERYYLPRDLGGSGATAVDAGDAMLGACPVYLNYNWREDRFSQVHHLWGGKSQGEPYHIYLLAVACLIEARLGTGAFVYGDITRGQCKRAVEIANQYLENKIDMPDRCYVDRFMSRVNRLKFSDKEKMDIFEALYLGTKDAAYGDALRTYFSAEDIHAYWKSKFEQAKIGTTGFDCLVSDYLLWGFEIDSLCKLVNYEGNNGQMLFEQFVTRIMDAKLHLEDKNCADLLKIDQEEERPYGIGTLFAQFAFAGARNKKVDRYIPIEVLRAALKRGLDGRFDPDPVMDAYLKKESEQMAIILNGEEVTKEQLAEAVQQDAAEAFGQMMERKKNQLAESHEKYDINSLEDLRGYKKGDVMPKELEESLGRSRKLMDSTLVEREYVALSMKSAKEKYEWIVLQNRYVMIRKDDWEKVFNDLEVNPDSFGRYYSLMRMDSSYHNTSVVVGALMVNDALYQYTEELAKR